MATQTQEVTQRMAPFQEDFLKKLFQDAQSVGAGRMPYAPQESFGLSAEQKKAASMAESGLGSYMPYLQQAQGAMQQAGAFAQPGAAQQFMNPYEDQVVQRTMSDIQKAGQQQQNQLSSQAANAGAFGGSRFAVGQAALGEANIQEQSRAAANIRQQGYQQAQQAAQNAAQLQAQQAGMYGTLGGQAQQMGVQDINTMLGIGGLTQQMGQQGLDFARQNTLQQQSEPFQRLGFLSDLFRGVPSAQQTTTTSSPSPSMGSQLMGLGIAGLGAYGMYGR
tara:strand:- start:1853 stop:2683 length:831 start_codon:yes stop_codon:yes gene_type:complete